MRLKKTFLIIIPALFPLIFSCAHSGRSHRVTDGVHKETLEEKAAADTYYKFLSSEELALQGNYNKSRVELDDVIKANPDMGYLYFELANNEFDQKHFPEAEASCLKALELSKDLNGARLLLSKLYSLQGKHPESISELDNAIKKNPKEEEAYFLLAREFIVLKRYDDAIGTINKFLLIEPDSTAGNLYLGMIFGSYLKQYERAIAAYLKVLDVDPENMRVMAALAQTYLEKRDVRRAMELFAKMEEMAPDDLSIQLKMALVYYYDLKRLDKAIAKFERILSVNPESDIIKYYLALVYAESGNMEVAVKYFEETPPNSNYYKDARINAAQYHFTNNDFDKGIRVIEEAISKKPEEMEFFLYMAGFYEQTRQYGKMVDVLKRGSVIHAKDEKMAYALAIAYERGGERARAVEAMKEVIRINPKNASALNYVGYSMVEEGKDLDEAETILQDAISIRPDDAYILDSLGWLYFKRGDLTKAYELLTQAAKILPKEVTILEHLGDLNKARGYSKQALIMYKRALKIAKGKNNGDGPSTGSGDGNGDIDIKRLEEKICAVGGC